jgi:hypothetical protein
MDTGKFYLGLLRSAPKDSRATAWEKRVREEISSYRLAALKQGGKTGQTCNRIANHLEKELDSLCHPKS